MKRSLKLLSLLTVVFCLCASSLANAQCGSPAKKTSLNSQPLRHGRYLKTASFTTDDQDRDRWGDDRDKSGLEPIVGLWKISFVDKDKDYTDTGYAAWHSDFTEFQNSEKAPSTGAVCQGVWEKSGRRTYRLNHYALGYTDGVTLSNIVRIREEVVVNESGNKFSGVFITDVYDTNHNLLVEFKGPITGKRVTMDSGIDSQ